ncbi:hypothetical protein BG000_003348 [Podila horticola]|nr:hypothetical protein BG000_003348 [Podila horticola]
MKDNTHRRRADSSYYASSFKAANHSKTTNSDDAKAVELSELYHPNLTHLISENPDHAKSQGKDDNHHSAREPLVKDNTSPLAEETSCSRPNSLGRSRTSQPLTLTLTSAKASRGSYTQDAKAEPPMYPFEEHDKNHPLHSQQLPTAPSDTGFTSPSPSPPLPNEEEKSPWGSKNPMTPTTIRLYSPPPCLPSSSNPQEELHRRLMNSNPPFVASYPHGWPHLPWSEAFEPNRFRNNLDAAVDLNELPIAPWCGTDLVGDPGMFFTHPSQARADDARHKRVNKWSLEEQQMRTQWHPQRYLRRPMTMRGQGTGTGGAGGTGGGQKNVGRGGGGSGGGGGCLRYQGQMQSQSQSQGQGGYADYGLLDQNDEVRATAKWAFEIGLSHGEGGGGGGGKEGGERILVPIRDTSAKLVDMAVSREQAEEEALFLPSVRDKYLSKAKEKEGFLPFLVRTICVEMGITRDKDKEMTK